MTKPNWLKSSYLRASLSQMIARRLTESADNRTTQNNVLIHSTDGLGDAILRLTTVSALVAKHGKEHTWVLTRAHALGLYEKLGIKTILYTDRDRVSPIARTKLVKGLRAKQFGIAYVLDFSLNENLLDLLEIPEKYGFVQLCAHAKPRTIELTEPIVHPGYVGDALRNFCEAARISPSIMDNRVLLNRGEKNSSDSTKKQMKIGLAVGASNLGKMMRVCNLAQIFYEITRAYPSSEIVLLGAGSRDEKYVSLVEKQFGSGPYELHNVQVSNKVSLLSVSDLIDEVQTLDLLVGFDSALYNLAFTLRIPTICMSYGDASVLHDYPWVRVVRGNGNPFGQPDQYGNRHTNSITHEEVIQAINDLNEVNSLLE